MRGVKLLDPETYPMFFTFFPFQANAHFSWFWKHQKTCSVFWGHGKGTMAFNAF